tara:strand:+ start:1550 stop:1750 length:201 start_codon:yes stop_codon:yes gene_type:complete
MKLILSECDVRNYTLRIVGNSERKNLQEIKKEYERWAKSDRVDPWVSAEYHGVRHYEIEIGELEVV